MLSSTRVGSAEYPTPKIAAASTSRCDAGVRHLAVVDGTDVVGVVSMRDLFAVLVDESPF